MDVYLLLSSILTISITLIFNLTTLIAVKKNNLIISKNSSKWTTKISRKKWLLSTPTSKKSVMSCKQSARTLTAIKLLDLLKKTHQIRDSVAKIKIPILKLIFIIITICHFKLRISTIITMVAIPQELRTIHKAKRKNEKVLWVLNHINRITISWATIMLLTHRFIIWIQIGSHLDWIR